MADGRRVNMRLYVSGQLTPKGREQHKALGNSLKQVIFYIDSIA
jgi:broad specificity phosphatase PhoE